MRNVYILNDHQSSTQNGIGTYLREITKCLEGCNICFIEFNSKESEFGIKSVNGTSEVHFPIFARNGFLQNYNIIDKLLRLHIEDSTGNVFILNHSPCENLLKAIKKAFPLSKTIFVIHDLGWTTRLLGDFELMKTIVSKEKRKTIKKKYQHILDYFHEEQRMYAIADKVICLSDDTYYYLQDVYGAEKNKLAFIFNGLTDTRIQIAAAKKRALKVKAGINPDEKILLIAGRTEPIKGVEFLLRAFSKVIKKYPNSRLIVVGPLFDPVSILKLSKQVAAKVSYTGLINRNELLRWYQIADIGVLPSFSEQCSYSGIEMMMHGLPVVASDGFCVKNMFSDGVNAKVAKIGNPWKSKKFEKNLTASILELLNSETLRKQLSKGARQIYESRYALKNMQDGYKKLLEELDD